VRDVCDGVDNNCNGTADEFLAMTRYRDADADGYSTGASVSMCQPDFSTGLMGQRTFDLSDARDDSGKAHTGTVNGATFGVGKQYTGAVFDGINDGIDISDHADLDLSQSYTLSARVKKTAGTGIQILMNKYGLTGTDYTYAAWINGNNTLHLRFSENNSAQITLDST